MVCDVIFRYYLAFVLFFESFSLHITSVLFLNTTFWEVLKVYFPEGKSFEIIWPHE